MAKSKPARDALLRIAAVLAPNDPRVAETVALSHDDGASYLKNHGKALAARHAAKLSPKLPWIALVVALEKAGRLAPIDWKTELEDVTAAIDRIARPRKTKIAWTWLAKRDDLDDRTTLELLEIVGEKLVVEHDIILAQLDIGSDSHELVLVAKKDAKELVALGKKAKYGDVDLFTGSDLRTFEKDRKKKDERARAKEEADPQVQRQLVHADGRVRITYGRTWRHDAGETHAVMRYSGVLGRFDALKDDGFVSAPTAKEAAIARKTLLDAWVREGFVEISREAFLKEEAAAARARKKPRKKAKK